MWKSLLNGVKKSQLNSSRFTKVYSWMVSLVIFDFTLERSVAVIQPRRLLPQSQRIRIPSSSISLMIDSNQLSSHLLLNDLASGSHCYRLWAILDWIVDAEFCVYSTAKVYVWFFISTDKYTSSRVACAARNKQFYVEHNWQYPGCSLMVLLTWANFYPTVRV